MSKMPFTGTSIGYLLLKVTILYEVARLKQAPHRAAGAETYLGKDKANRHPYKGCVIIHSLRKLIWGGLDVGYLVSKVGSSWKKLLRISRLSLDSIVVTNGLVLRRVTRADAQH